MNSERRKVYNPRRMRWEYEDGTPTETETSIPFGNYKGEPLSQVPTEYLRWVVDIITKPSLRTAVEEELKRR